MLNMLNKESLTRVALVLAAAANLQDVKPAQAQSQKEVISYSQCGSNEDPEGMVVFVEKITEKGSERFETYKLGFFPGQCGNKPEEIEYIPISVLTLKKSDGIGGFIYGPKNVPMACPSWANRFEVRNTEMRQGEGLDSVSGGLNPGYPFENWVYINGSKPNGEYNGTQIISCVTKNGTSLPLKKIGYRISLVD